jgi:hypothetical protein
MFTGGIKKEFSGWRIVCSLSLWASSFINSPHILKLNLLDFPGGAECRNRMVDAGWREVQANLLLTNSSE